MDTSADMSPCAVSTTTRLALPSMAAFAALLATDSATLSGLGAVKSRMTLILV